MDLALYNLINSPIFWILVGIWIAISLFSVKRLTELGNKLWGLISKPVVFEHDDDPDSIRGYPRAFLEAIAKVVFSALQMPFHGLVVGLGKWTSEQTQKYSETNKPFLAFGLMLFFLLTALFIYLDLIAITQALVSLGLVPLGTVWEPLNNYALAMAGGSIFAILIAILILEQIGSEVSAFTYWDQRRQGSWIRIARVLINFLIVSGTVAVLLLGLQRLIALGYIQDLRETVELAVNVGISILVPLNTILTTSLIFSEGILGFAVFLTLLAGLLRIIFFALDYVAVAVGWFFPFALDVIYRLVFFVLIVVWYFFYTPINIVGTWITGS
jgi:hypothetical protein